MSLVGSEVWNLLRDKTETGQGQHLTLIELSKRKSFDLHISAR